MSDTLAEVEESRDSVARVNRNSKFREGGSNDEGGVVTGHRVHVPEGLVDDLQLQDVDATQLVRESLGFLLDRVPATSVPAGAG